MSTTDQTEQSFKAKYSAETDALNRFTALGAKALGPGSSENLKLLAKLHTDGISITRSRRTSAGGQEEIDQLVGEFIEFGAKAILLTGAQRGGDFLNNQLRGHWAERVVLSMPIDKLQLVRFGPSGAAMPGEEDHRRVIMTYKEIQLLEGKRPDLLAFDETVWSNLSEAERTQAMTWPTRRLEATDNALVQKARCGIEVKNSTWLYSTRREQTPTPLSITVKEEEREHFTKWCTNTAVPLIFMQVLFDEIYCMSFARMEEALTRGFLYRQGDYEHENQKGEKKGKARKSTHAKELHKFHLEDDRHLCGKVVFPDKSSAVVASLKDGSVVPFIRFEPATAYDVVPAVITTEIGFVSPPEPRRSRRP